jgi:hypothetical protein
MSRYLLIVLFVLAAPAQAQDNVEAALQAGLTQGTAVRLAEPASNGMRRVITLTPSAALAADEVVALLERVRLDLAMLGVTQPSPAQLATVLAGEIPLALRTEFEADPRTPTPDEQAYAKLPQDLQLLLRGLPPREALQKVEFARQNLIALGTPNPAPERLRAMVEGVLAPRYAAVQSASAGATSFPPLSPLVAAPGLESR